MSSAYSKKYISLKEAATMSGYTIPELRNFIKIGLIPSKKQKNKIVVPFSAFEKISEQQAPKVENSPKAAPAVATPSHSLTLKPLSAVIPFTTPNKHLVKVLESTALSAAMVMAFYVGTLPTVAEKIVFSLELSNATIAYMGQSAENLIENSVAMPVAAMAKIAAVQTYAPTIAQADDNGLVAGAMTVSSTVATQNESGDSDFVNLMNNIADLSDSFERQVNNLAGKTQEVLIGNYTFDNIDEGMQVFFRL